jgi:hypothetical protein
VSSPLPAIHITRLEQATPQGPEVFAKLGINSRTKLAQTLPPEPGAALLS